MKLGTGVIRQIGGKPIRHFDIGGTRFTHTANWEHIGKVLAEKQRRLKVPLLDEVL